MTFDPMYIPAGSLRHSIKIMASSDTRDEYGAADTSWTTLLATRGSVKATLAASYKDSFAQNALAAQSTELVTIRWPGKSIVITPGMRLYVDDSTEYWTIQAVENVEERNRIVRLACLALQEKSA